MFVPVLLVVSLVGAAPAERVDLVFGGDIIPHDGVKQAAAEHALSQPGGAARAVSLNHEGWDFVLEPIARELRAADLAVVNLETPISGNPRAPTAPLIFDAPPQLAHALVSAGVDVVSIANNHAFDQRRAGIPSTWSHLDAAGLKHVGSAPTEAMAWEPLVVERKGMRVGLLSITRWLNGASNPDDPDRSPHVAYVPYPTKKRRGLTPEAVAALVGSAARRCDALIVMIHWGTEYSHSPKPEDRRLAQSLLEAGALAVVGHHPHVLQPIESYRTRAGRDTVVAFSLGNLIANQDGHYVHGAGAEARGRKRDSMLFRLSLSRPHPGAPVELAGTSVLPVWIDTNYVVALREREGQHRIQPVLLDEELKTLSGQLLAFSASGPPRKVREERRELERRLDLARRRRALILRMTLPPSGGEGSGSPAASVRGVN
ncbi:CapA family protein [Cystobacter fuscus]|uniref:CapA family protein n=1 Tax=Cystobacter fuscus TaxID=43 RepID=UPI002B28EE21|nr:CapA family protein [Cystobacter fuscus]